MKILWVARAPAPYRYPIWRLLSERATLCVAFLQKQGIGRAWRVQKEGSFDQVVLPAAGARYREDALWLLLPSWRMRIVRPDVIVMQGLWETPAAWQILLYAKLRRIPIVYFSESTLVTMRRRHGPLAWARGFYMRRAAFVLTPGPAATEAVRRHRVPDDRIVTSANVIDVQRFKESAWAARRRRAVPASPRVGHKFLAVARMVPLKNLATLVSAFAEIKTTEDELVLVGDGPLRRELEARVAALGLSAQVRFLGALSEDEVIEQLAMCHTLVLPSTEEVWGLVVNEALAAGLHAIVSDRCGVSRSVAGMAGVQVCAPSSRELAGAMSRSRANWGGWIEHPEILRHDAEGFVAHLWPPLSHLILTKQSLPS